MDEIDRVSLTSDGPRLCRIRLDTGMSDQTDCGSKFEKTSTEHRIQGEGQIHVHSFDRKSPALRRPLHVRRREHRISGETAQRDAWPGMATEGTRSPSAWNLAALPPLSDLHLTGEPTASSR